MSYALVTTALETSWPLDKPILFLGDWCCRYHRRDVWRSLDFEIAAPFTKDIDVREQEQRYLEKIFSKLLDEITEALNQYHHCYYPKRFWHIVLGHWLVRYIMICFNRYFSLIHANENHAITETLIFDDRHYSLATEDSKAFIDACGDDVWNHFFYVKIIKFLNKINYRTLENNKPCQTSFKSDGAQVRQHQFKKVVLWITDYVLPKLCRVDDALIVSTYLPRSTEIKLALAIGQVPQFFRSPRLSHVNYDSKIRQSMELPCKNLHGFELFIRQLIFECIPICYLEGFSLLKQQVEALPWPERPKFIFTSNRFDTDEIFKVYVGLKVEKKCRYFVGQHGNNYGTIDHKLIYQEVTTSDKFITWGWRNEWCGDSVKKIPAFIFKDTIYKSFQRNKHDKILFIQMQLGQRIMMYDECHFDQYLTYQSRFVNALTFSLREKLIIRLHGSWIKGYGDDLQRWVAQYPSINVELGKENIKKLINKSRLVIHSYDSTGMLETLAGNIPTLCFWFDGFDHLDRSVKPYYEQLRKVNIIVDTPEQAAELVNRCWEKIEEWWNDEKLQDARKQFCDQFARIEKKKIRKLKQLLLEQ